MNDLETLCISNIEVKNPALVRQKIADLEAKMRAMPQIPIQETHRFSKGVYAREIFIPKGTLLVGKIHKHLNMNIISQGDVSFMSIDGTMRVQAPYTFVASPGVKRTIYAHKDTVWTTIHGTEETDLHKIEMNFIATDYEDLYLSTNRTFEDALSALGGSAEELKAISENETDQIPFPTENTSVRVADSKIHGKGLFAAVDLHEDQIVAPARIGSLRTPVGRFANHSGAPNARMVMRENGDVDLVTNRAINAGEEILTDYYFNFTNTRSQVCRG